METSDAPYVTFLGADDWRIVIVLPGVPNGFLKDEKGKSLKFSTRELAEEYIASKLRSSS